MSFTEREIAHLKKIIKDRVENYRDLEGMVAAGRLIYKGGWYEATDAEAHNAIVQHAREIRFNKNDKVQIKFAKQDAKLKALAQKL